MACSRRRLRKAASPVPGDWACVALVFMVLLARKLVCTPALVANALNTADDVLVCTPFIAADQDGFRSESIGPGFS